MKNIRIEKTDTGYVLHPSASNYAGIACLSALCVIGGGCTLAFSPLTPFTILGGLLLVGLGIYFLLMSFRRVVIDEDGVRLYRLGRLSRDIPWRHVKAWGIITQSIRSRYQRQNVSYLYFSPVKGQTTGLKSVFMEISPKDEAEIAKLHLKKFIRRHLQEDDEAY